MFPTVGLMLEVISSHQLGKEALESEQNSSMEKEMATSQKLSTSDNMTVGKAKISLTIIQFLSLSISKERSWTSCS